YMTTKWEQRFVVTSKQKKIQIGHKKTKHQQQLFFGLGAHLFWGSVLLVDIDWGQFVLGVQKLPVTIPNMMEISFTMLPAYLEAMVMSLVVAFLSLLLGLVLSLISAFFVARNIAPSKWF